MLILTAAVAIGIAARRDVAHAPWLLAPAAFGIFLALRPHDYLVFRGRQSVILEMKKPLDLLSFHYESSESGLDVHQPALSASVRTLGPCVFLSFRLSGRTPEKELYLARTLIKYQRTLRKIV